MPVVEYAAEVFVAVAPVDAFDFVGGVDAEEVVEVDLVGVVVLLLVEVELVGHLVGEVEGFATCVFVTHCIGGYRQCD